MNYKKYSLEKLEEWVYDSLNAGEATAQEIYDTIKGVVQEQSSYHKIGALKSDELLQLLNGYVPNQPIQFNFNNNDFSYFDNMCGVGNTSDYCNNSWNSFWENDVIQEDKVVKWQLPVEVDDVSEEYYVQFPDDLLEAANLNAGDLVEWVDNGNGSYTLRKTNAV